MEESRLLEHFRNIGNVDLVSGNDRDLVVPEVARPDLPPPGNANARSENRCFARVVAVRDNLILTAGVF
jgi:hypothetical protein